MNLDLTGKRALVCGSSQGIGLAAAIELAGLGCTVVLFARDRGRLENAQRQLPTPSNQRHQIMVADFSDSAAVVLALDTWLAENGGFEIVVNNSGGPPAGALLTSDIPQFLAAFANHLVVNQLIAQRVVPHMQRQKFGRIVNVISTSVKQPIHGLGVSNTIRGAVASWAKTLSAEVAPFGITVNNVLPGATRTARLDSILEGSAAKSKISVSDAEQKMLGPIPAGRFAEPSEIGAAIAFLASPAAGYITGINLPVDGGRTQCL